ncbi:hypothetical protein R0E42_001370 [Klebsiella variicola]|uniref:hypothetical protein n=1 Tax=Klebsiella variicola TaxID=244366 RepID=UPI00280BB453|nr:hypothetical protein [Klebsiella variicola]ELN9654405.1 hypothetical protein [Klebsiella variicola]
MNHTLNDSQLEEMIKSAVNSSGPLPPDEKFSLLISALRELQERRKADSEPVAVPDEVRQELSKMDDEILAELKDDESRQEGIRKCMAALGYHHRRAEECSPGYAGSSLEEDTLTGIDFLRGANRAAMIAVASQEGK